VYFGSDDKIMKKFLTSTGLLALSVSGLQSAVVHDLSPIEASKPWSVSAALRGFYDDNYTTLPSHSSNPLAATAQESFGYEFTPSVSLNLPFDQTFFGVSYEYSLRFYEDRSDNKYDQSHKFDLRLDHSFSERYKIEVNDSFVIAQEPEVLTTGAGAIAIPLRTEGDNIRNRGSIDFTAQMTELLAVELGYANTFYDYEQERNDGIPSRSGLLDRIEHQASVNLRWQMLPETDGILGYRFGIVDFTSDEEIALDANNEPISADIRNSRSHQVYVGADHRFNSRLNGSVRVGGEYSDYYNQGENTISPFIDANLAYQYGRGDYVQVGITHSRNKTDVAGFDTDENVTLDQESTAIYTSINHKFTPNLVGSLLVQGQRATFEGGASDGDAEYFLLSGINLTYHFNPHLLAEVGYNFDRLDSDIVDRSYSRNRVYVGVRATY
jgi:hypothetical protein